MSPPADPELLLAAACCRWPPSATRDAAVRAAAVAIDWPRFGRVVKRQRIAGLVEGALRTAGVVPPDAIARAVAEAARRIVQRNLLATGETARLTRSIAAAGYPVLAVKGVVLGALAYGSIVPKHGKDIDLLILPEHSAAVIALLEADGYRLTTPAAHLSAAQRRILPRYGKDVSLVRAGHQLELHWRLFANAALLPAVTARARSQEVAVGSGLTIPTLARDDLYAYLVLHGAVDGWSRMKWLADVHALIAPYDAATLRALHAAASARGAERASAQALLMMRDLFALPLPADFAATLATTRHVPRLVAGAYRLMAVADGSTEIADWWAGRMLSLAMQPLLAGGVRYQWQIVKSVLYMQGDMYRSTIPPALYPLYPVIRVPVWLARQIARLAQGFSGRARVAQ